MTYGSLVGSGRFAINPPDQFSGVYSPSTLVLEASATQVATTTEVTSSRLSSVYGQAVTFTATVAAEAPGGGTPTGSVQFVIDGSDYGAPVSLSGGTASISDADLSVSGSPHTVTAVYTSSDGHYVGSEGALTDGQTVTPAELTVTGITAGNKV